MIQETNFSCEKDKSVEEQAPEVGILNSSSETGKEGEYKEVSKKVKKKKGKKTKVLTGKAHRMRTRNRGIEVTNLEDWNIEEEIAKVREIGVQLGLDFKGRETEMAEFIRKRENEEADQLGQGRG